MSGAVKLLPCPLCRSDDIYCDHETNVACCNRCDNAAYLSLWNTRAPDPAVAALEAEVARLRADVTYERGLNGRDAERIFTLSLLDDEIEVLTNAASSFDVQDGIALAAFRKRLVGLWRARDRLPAPSEKEAG